MYYNKQQNAIANVFGAIAFISIILSLIDQFGFIDIWNAGYLFLIGLAALVMSMIFKAVSGYYSARKSLVTFVRIFVGGLFIFSGFVKAIDPLGTAYKIGEYFHEFDLMFLDPLTVGFSVIMIVLEFVLGIMLLLGYQAKLTTWLLFLTIIFFTFLTGYTSVTGNVTDCGCFGDFLKLEPIQSFIKDLILFTMILILLFNRKFIEPFFSKFISGAITVLVTIGALLFCFSNYIWGLPSMDFRPYKVGKNIPSQMTVPEGRQPVYEYVFVYENTKTGEQKEFSADNLPTGKEWSFVDRKDILVKEGETPNINNFQIVNAEGEDISDDILYDPNYLFMVVAYDLGKTYEDAFTEKLNPIAKAAEKEGYRFFAVSSAGPEESDKFRHKYQTPYPFHEADAIFLKTIIRSNPGLVILKEGNVIAKWHYKQIPSFEEIKENYLK